MGREDQGEPTPAGETPEEDRLGLTDSGPAVARLQGRLRELGYLAGPVSERYGIRTGRAVALFRAFNRDLIPTDEAAAPEQHSVDSRPGHRSRRRSPASVADGALLAHLYSDRALAYQRLSPPPEDVDDEEAEELGRWIAAALRSSTGDPREETLAHAFQLYGGRFLRTLGALTSEDERLSQLCEEAIALFAEWLEGRDVTGDADEYERRVAVCWLLLREPGPHHVLHAIAAKRVLSLPPEHPLCDAERAAAVLSRRLEDARNDLKPEAVLSAITAVLDSVETPDEEVDCLRAEAARVSANVEDRAVRFRFELAGRAWAMGRALESQDEAEAERRHLAAAREHLEAAEALAEPGDAHRRAQLQVLRGFQELQEGRLAESAITLREAIDAGVASPEMLRHAARFEARALSQLGRPKGVVAALTPVLDDLRADFLCAPDRDKASLGQAFASASGQLARAHAQLGNEAEALYALEGAKSLELRHRAAERASGKMRQSVEHAMHRTRRGVTGPPQLLGQFLPGKKRRDLGGPHDRVAQVLGEAAWVRTTEQRFRERVAGVVPYTPDADEVARRLGPGEAAVSLGIERDAAMMFVIEPSSSAAASARDGEATGPMLAGSANEWARVALLEEDGWLRVLSEGGESGDREIGLDTLLRVVDEWIGEPLAARLTGRGIERLTIVPHKWLHMVPFWALPSLAHFRIQTAPSLATFFETEEEPARLGRSSQLVGNPTSDLVLSAAELAVVAHHLRDADFEVREVRIRGRTAASVGRAIGETAMFHFSGHGRSDVLNPMRSALLMPPGRDWMDLVPGAADPFAGLLEDAEHWRTASKGQRMADMPGGGALFEALDDSGRVVERRLEFAEQGNFWAAYPERGQPIAAELLTAGDILFLPRRLGRCSFVFLSACESGLTGLDAERDEAQGLPTAFLSSGARAVVSTLWPVSEIATILFADHFYAQLTSAIGVVDLAELLVSSRRALRDLRREEAADRLEAIADITDSGRAVFELEALAAGTRSGAERPFAHPYHWAPFTLMGSRALVIEDRA